MDNFRIFGEFVPDFQNDIKLPAEFSRAASSIMRSSNLWTGFESSPAETTCAKEQPPLTLEVMQKAIDDLKAMFPDYEPTQIVVTKLTPKRDWMEGKLLETPAYKETPKRYYFHPDDWQAFKDLLQMDTVSGCPLGGMPVIMDDDVSPFDRLIETKFRNKS